MKHLTCIIICIACTLAAYAADTAFVYSPNVPLLKGNRDNVLFYIAAQASGTGKHTARIEVTFNGRKTDSTVKSMKLYSAGTDASRSPEEMKFAPAEYILPSGKANSSYSVLLDEIPYPGSKAVLESDIRMFKGLNYLWISLELNEQCSLEDEIAAEITYFGQDGEPVRIADCSEHKGPKKPGIAVRRAGDDGVAAYRIPGLVTTGKGTLLAVYDVRYNSSADLQEHIDIGLSRSTDGGNTWEKMRIPMTFSGYGGLPDAQNGVGDPCILYDPTEDRVWIAAVWCHGMGNRRAWTASNPGMDTTETGQLVLAYSDDDGQNWSAPINITDQIKKHEWHFLLQGPGRGLAADDGTLVFPVQFIGEDKIPCAGIMYSLDKGKTWNIGNPARSNTTESQAVQLPDGSIMLNMRDNRGGSRAVAITGDLGETWVPHPSSRSLLREPVCMASIIRVKATDNVTGKDFLAFSNPDSESGRKDITVKFSFDNGLSWPEEYNVLLDEDTGWGYSCLTLVDREHIGILYESSAANITFQLIPLKHLLSD